MKISPIKFNIQKMNFSGLQKNNEQKNSIQNKAFEKSNVYGDNSKIYLDGIKELKNEVNLFPEDIEYRKNLLKDMGMNENDYFKLRPIIGSAEIQKIMSDFSDKPDYFVAGENMENVKAGKIRANLHIHTLASDGFLSIQELLNKAAHYANFVASKNPEAKNTPFVIGITDHDTIESTQEAIKIIANNPLKYKNLRVILGLEMTTYNNVATDVVDYPTNTHVLAYGINPNEKEFKNFIENTKKTKLEITDKMINDANNLYEDVFGKKSNFSVSGSRKFSNLVDKGLLGIYKHVLRYVQTEFVINDILLKNEEIVKTMKENAIPTKTDDFLKSLEEFYYPVDKNNYMRKPQVAISEFLSAKTNLSAEKVSEVIENGLKEPKAAKFYKELSQNYDRYKVTLNPQYKYMPTFADVYNSLKNQDKALIGLAHPLDATNKISNKEDKMKFLKDFYKKFMESCKEKAKFSEAYYQSYSGDVKAFSKDMDAIKFLDLISKKYNLFKTGSADTHRTNIFKRYM